ncbi:MAG: uroporphyrinogen-III C-methyltransferase [Oligoflexus sp.]
MHSGFVSLIGAGPGRAEFLTLAAIRSLEAAEVILYDALIGADIQAYFPKNAKHVYVGKRCGEHSLSQTEINERLVLYGLQGYRIARLKGGDPFIFGRGSEEVTALRQHGISYRIIPGISALNGIAAAVGLPLTARTHSNEFRVIQGHNLPRTREDWQSLASYRGTLVIFMGINKLPQIIQQLLEHQANPQHPIAIIETDIEGKQIVSKGSLASFHAEPFQKRSSGPGIVYIGSNVDLMPEQFGSQFEEEKDELLIAHFS